MMIFYDASMVPIYRHDIHEYVDTSQTAYRQPLES